jgi:hypothetical protein
MDLELLQIFGLLALGAGAIIYVVILLVRPDRVPKPPRRQWLRNGQLVLVIFVGLAVLASGWRLYAGPGESFTGPSAQRAAELAAWPGPGAPCSNERMNYLAKYNVEQMRTQFRECVGQLQQRQSR